MYYKNIARFINVLNSVDITLLQDDENVNNVIQDGFSLLHLAVMCERIVIVKSLLCNVYCDINIRGVHGFRPIHLACLNGNVRILRLLLNHGANINVFNSREDTPIHCASQEGNKECIELLFSMYPMESKEMLKVKNYFGITPMKYAVFNGNKDIYYYLIRSIK